MDRRKRIHQAALALMFALAGAGAAAATIRTEYREEDRALVIEASASVDASSATVWTVLTDYARYPDFIPGARDARIVRRAQSSVTVLQSWSLAFGPLQIPLDVVYDIVEIPPDEVRSSAVVGRLGTLRSRYTVEASDHGAVLRYRGRFTSSSTIAFAFQSGRAREVMSSQFRALVDEIERHGRLAASSRRTSRAADLARRGSHDASPVGGISSFALVRQFRRA